MASEMDERIERIRRFYRDTIAGATNVHVERCVTTDEYRVSFCLDGEFAECHTPDVPVGVDPNVKKQRRDERVDAIDETLNARARLKAQRNVRPMSGVMRAADEALDRLYPVARSGKVWMDNMLRERESEIAALKNQVDRYAEQLAERDKVIIHLRNRLAQSCEDGGLHTGLADVPAPRPKLRVYCEGDW